MRGSLALLLLCSLAETAAPATLVVPTSFPTIQAAINVAAPGDTVLVMPGTYLENIDFKGKAIAVRSNGGPDVTTIDGQQKDSVVYFRSAEGPNSVLEGFTITKGHAFNGGGIYCYGSSPTITGNHIVNNLMTTFPWPRQGGGIFCHTSSPRITNNRIVGNQVGDGLAAYAFAFGGGIYCELGTPQITGNLIADNYSSWRGGGIYCKGPTTVLLRDNVFDQNVGGGFGVYGGAIAADGASLEVVGNRFVANFGSGGGGAIRAENCPSLVVAENEIVENHCEYAYGGALELYSIASLRVVGNVFAGNFVKTSSSYTRGGAVHCQVCDKAVFDNNLFRGNSSAVGGALDILACTAVTGVNNTFVDNYSNKSDGWGGALHCEAAPAVSFANSIYWGNTAKSGPSIYVRSSSSLTLAHCDVEGGQPSIGVAPTATLTWGAGMLAANPQFVDPGKNDHHLQFGSPCRDTGNTGAAGTLMSDYEGDPRVFGAAVDMGADEFAPHLYVVGDPAPGAQLEVKLVGLPMTAPVALAAGLGLLEPPLSGAYGDWYLAPPCVLLPGLGPIPATGIYVLPGVLPGNPGPYEVHLQAFVGYALTNLSTLRVE